MKKRYWAFLIGSWCLSVGMQAAKVDTLSVHSDAMNKEVQVITICPDKAMAGEKCPVLYLLHGYGGNAGTWLGIKPELPRIADKEGIIFVCPDGKNSDFQNIYRNGKSYANRLLVMYVMRNGEESNQLGISVSKKVGNSVVRHHIARLMREIFRLNNEKIETGLNIIVVARTAAATSDYKHLEGAYMHLCGLHHILKESK